MVTRAFAIQSDVIDGKPVEVKGCLQDCETLYGEIEFMLQNSHDPLVCRIKELAEKKRWSVQRTALVFAYNFLKALQK